MAQNDNRDPKDQDQEQAEGYQDQNGPETLQARGGSSASEPQTSQPVKPSQSSESDVDAEDMDDDDRDDDQREGGSNRRRSIS